MKILEKMTNYEEQARIFVQIDDLEKKEEDFDYEHELLELKIGHTGERYNILKGMMDHEEKLNTINPIPALREIIQQTVELNFLLGIDVHNRVQIEVDRVLERREAANALEYAALEEELKRNQDVLHASPHYMEKVEMQKKLNQMEKELAKMSSKLHKAQYETEFYKKQDNQGNLEHEQECDRLLVQFRQLESGDPLMNAQDLPGNSSNNLPNDNGDQADEISPNQEMVDATSKAPDAGLPNEQVSAVLLASQSDSESSITLGPMVIAPRYSMIPSFVATGAQHAIDEAGQASTVKQEFPLPNPVQRSIPKREDNTNRDSFRTKKFTFDDQLNMESNVSHRPSIQGTKGFSKPQQSTGAHDMQPNVSPRKTSSTSPARPQSSSRHYLVQSSTTQTRENIRQRQEREEHVPLNIDFDQFNEPDVLNASIGRYVDTSAAGNPMTNTRNVSLAVSANDSNIGPSVQGTGVARNVQPIAESRTSKPQPKAKAHDKLSSSKAGPTKHSNANIRPEETFQDLVGFPDGLNDSLERYSMFNAPRTPESSRNNTRKVRFDIPPDVRAKREPSGQVRQVQAAVFQPQSAADDGFLTTSSANAQHFPTQSSRSQVASPNVQSEKRTVTDSFNMSGFCDFGDFVTPPLDRPHNFNETFAVDDSFNAPPVADGEAPDPLKDLFNFGPEEVENARTNRENPHQGEEWVAFENDCFE